MKDAVQDDAARRTRKPYKTPEVVAYGSVVELTTGTGSPLPDSGSMGTKSAGGGSLF